MYFMSIYCSLNFHESKSNPVITSIENQKFHGSESCIVEEITDLLLKKREKLSGATAKCKPNMDRNISERINVHNTLKILLGVSKTAKKYLLQGNAWFFWILVSLKMFPYHSSGIHWKHFNGDQISSPQAGPMCPEQYRFLYSTSKGERDKG